jgi:hypothetical protein
MTIREWPALERPRERLLERGAHALSDAELAKDSEYCRAAQVGIVIRPTWAGNDYSMNERLSERLSVFKNETFRANYGAVLSGTGVSLWVVRPGKSLVRFL